MSVIEAILFVGGLWWGMTALCEVLNDIGMEKRRRAAKESAAARAAADALRTPEEKRRLSDTLFTLEWNNRDV